MMGGVGGGSGMDGGPRGRNDGRHGGGGLPLGGGGGGMMGGPSILGGPMMGGGGGGMVGGGSSHALAALASLASSQIRCETRS
jgi:pilus assembly protein CpaC